MPPYPFERIESIYQVALKLEPDERSAYLDSACLGNTELRREVEALLEQATERHGVTFPKESRSGSENETLLDSTVTVVNIGTQLGPYKIEAPLGRGGMGEVFRAVDTRLGRKVAIKISSEKFNERFEREAHAISALNHPNICTLHDVGASPSGVAYLVMELLEGESLAERLKRGKLPIEETIKYGTQIADALAAAHAKGITHRDLKPGNIMLTKTGIKVLDFGLAKSAHDATMTASNVVMGTPAYMAPEQFERKEADARTDIYALGLVLYEMAAGKRATQGQMPPLDELPPPFAHVVERCLPQDPEERWQTAKDVQSELGWIARSKQTAAVAQSALGARQLWALGFLAVVGSLGLAAVIYLRPAATEQPVQFSLLLDRTAYGDVPRISPHGDMIVFPAIDAAGRRQLWLRRLESDDAKPIVGTDDALYPFWSADGRSIGFYAQQKLKRINLDGGGGQTIISLPAFDGTAAWSSTGEILYAPGNRTALYRVSDKGGNPREFSRLDASRGENSHRLVRFLSDGKRFLFSARSSNRENNALYSGSIDSGDIRRIASIQSNVAYVPPMARHPGTLVFVRESVLYRQPFDGATLSGEPVRLMDIGYRAISMQGFFDVSADGKVLLTRPPYTIEQRLTWFDRKGTNLGTLGSVGTFEQPQISPNGDRVIFNRPDDNGGNRDVWLIETARGTASRLTVNQANEWNAIWAPDGRRIAFASDRTGTRDGSTWEKTSMDPGAGENRVEGLPDWANPEDWSRDGKWIAFSNGAQHGDIWIAPFGGDRKPFRFFDSGFEDRIPRFSPDGNWIAYHSNESGRFEIYVRPFYGKPAQSGEKIQISLQGGFYATWSRTGKELFFLGPDSKLYYVPVTDLGHSKSIPTPQPLFIACPGNVPTGSATQGSGFDVAPGGSKFLFACSTDLPNKYTITINWQALP
jgi:eukaryotic-like serine/threonine-protein kinase